MDNNSEENVLRFEVVVSIEDINLGPLKEEDLDLAVTRIRQMVEAMRNSDAVRKQYSEEFLVNLVNIYPELVSKVETAIESGMNNATVETK